MYTAQYSCSKSYFHFKVPEELPEEGLLEGNSGKIRFKRVQDGLAVYDSTLLTSGFLCSGDCDAIYVPHTINQLPVTELHQSIVPRPGASLCIENGNLKRVFLEISQNSIRTKAADTDSIANIVSLYIMLEKENRPQNVPPEVKIDFVGSPTNEVDFCSINCHDRLVLHIPSAKAVKVNANQTDLRGEVPACVEQITFSGKIYPFIEQGWNEEEPNIACFTNLKNLRIIEGTLAGNICWRFTNCTVLERVHLSNGITEIPAYAFSNCRSLQDLYIPDTVSAIGAYAFNGCTNLSTIHLPPNLKHIPEGMFNGCKSLKKVFLADTIETIGDYAFAGCTSLRKPWIPKNIQHISETAFSVSEK